VIVTFDESGVSGHPNHVSLLRGAKEYVSTVAPHARLYTLTSVSILRKYISILDGVVTLAVRGGGGGGGGGGGLVFVSSVRGYRRAQRAMTDAHVSQMRWFRWGWIALSRYMVVNDLVLREQVEACNI
jgi:N-acetylglucosaminylphosphatidylinositol deacetylase